MDINTVSAAATAAGQTDTTVGIAVLRKVLDIETQNALQLLEALPAPVPYNNPPNLGQNVDTRA